MLLPSLINHLVSTGVHDCEQKFTQRLMRFTQKKEILAKIRKHVKEKGKSGLQLFSGSDSEGRDEVRPAEFL